MKCLVLLRYPHSDPLLSLYKEVHKSILNGLSERHIQTEKPSTFKLKNIRKQIRLQYPLKLLLREYC